jgi:hypothetical protein
MKASAKLLRMPPPALQGSDPLTLNSLLEGFEHVGFDRRGGFSPEQVTLWSSHHGINTGSPAMLVGTRPGNVLVVLADFGLNQGEPLTLDKQLRVDGLQSQAPCLVVSSRPGLRAADRRRPTYVLELQRTRA